MNNSWKQIARRTISLVLSLVLTLTLVTPTAFAVEGAYETGEDTSLTTPLPPQTDEQPAMPTEDADDADEGNNTEIAPFSMTLLSSTPAVATTGAVEEKNGVYEITTAQQLAWLAQEVNSGNDFAGKTFKLGADIDLSAVCHAAGEGTEEVNWTPIGNSTNKFSGTFDGQGHTISKLYYSEEVDATSAYKAYAGLFGNNTGTIRNLIVTGSVSVKNTANKNVTCVGGIVGYSYNGTVQNCGFSGIVTVKKNVSTDWKNGNGGVVGNNLLSTVANCWYCCSAEDKTSVTQVGVSGSTPTNSYQNVSSSSKGSHAGDLNVETVIKGLNTGNDACGMKWEANTGKGYPTLRTYRTVTVKKYLSDCTATVQIVDGDGDPVTSSPYEISADATTVDLKLSDGYTGESIYVKSDLAQPCVDSAKLTSSAPPLTYYIGSDTTVTLYYGTKADFEMDDSWYINAVGNNYTITNAKQLRYLAYLVNDGTNNFSGKTITLTSDIELTGNWTSIGSDSNPFKGTFDGNLKTISGLKGSLFGTVQGGEIKRVSIAGTTGRLVDKLTSSTELNKYGNVNNCSTTTGSELVGSTDANSTVSNCYCYDVTSKKPVVGTNNGTVTSCFYLASESTFGASSDTGARTAEEFSVGRVTWELNGKQGGTTVVWKQGEDKPTLSGSTIIYELTLTKLSGEGSVTIDDEGVLTNGNTQYLYGKEGTNVNVTEPTLTGGNTLFYFPQRPTVISTTGYNATANTYYYTIGKEITPDYSWYTEHEGDETYVLRTAQELAGFAALVNGTAKDAAGTTMAAVSFSGKTVKLGDDIDLEGYSWTPIGVGYVFNGTFDGGNHAIRNLNVNVANGRHAGLFGQVQGGIVQHLQVEGSANAGGTSFAGGIVGYLMSGTVQNCLSNVTVTGTSYTGGVVGYSESTGTVKNCRNEGDVTGTNSHAGGIVGYGSATNCYNSGTVTANGSAAYGIAPTATNCYNTGNVIGAVDSTYGIGQTVTNSYCICKVNGTETKQYIENSTTSMDITYVSTSMTYMVGRDTLVDKLNDNCGSNTPWFVNTSATPPIIMPTFVYLWNGELHPDCPYTFVTVTYKGNGGITADDEEEKTYSVRVNTDGEDRIIPATYTLETFANIGFRHENGSIKASPWNTKQGGDGTPRSDGETITLTGDLTLYAQWDKIWDGSGTENDPYQISDADKLTALQTKTGEGFNYAGKWFKLTNDITLTGSWTPISGFCGNLDGGNKRISGLNVEAESEAGLFGSIGASLSPATVKNLTISGSFKTTKGGKAGALAASASATLDNVYAVNVTVHTQQTNATTFEPYTAGTAGGIVGSGNVNMTNCSASGKVTGGCAGGLVGTVTNNGKFIGCVNSAVVTSEGTGHVGDTPFGAAGIAYGRTYNETPTFTDCRNENVVKAKGDAAGIGMTGHFTNCRNSSNVTSTGGDASGIVQNGKKIERCFNSGTITGKEAAGIVHTHSGSIEKCGNIGTVKSTGNMNRAYGIALKLESNQKIQYCFTYVLDLPLAPAGESEKVSDTCYYLVTEVGSDPSAGTPATKDDFAGGKVAWGVDGGEDAHKNYWTQGGDGYPVPIGEGTSTSYYRARVTYGTGGTATITRKADTTLGITERSGDADNAVYGPQGTSVTVTATPKDDTYALKSLTLDLMGTGSAVSIESGESFTLHQANAEVVAAFTGGGTGGGSGSGSGGEGQGDGNGEGDGSGTEADTGLQSGSNPNVEYNVKSLVLSAYGAWGASGSGQTFGQWLQANPQTLRNLVTNSLDNMAGAAKGKDTAEAGGLAAMLLNSLNESCGVDGKSGTAMEKALQSYLNSAGTDSFTNWLTSGSGMASGTVESVLAQYTESLLALTDRLYTKWESSGTSMTFPVWLDAQQVSVENLSETAQEPEQDTTNDPQTTDAPEDVPDGQESEGGSAGGGNSIWAVIGDAVRQNPIIVWSIVTAVAAIVIVGAVRRYHKVKKDERSEDNK